MFIGKFLILKIMAFLKIVNDYGFMVDEGGLICPKCADNPLYKGELDRVDKEGYPDGYTCDDCGEVSK
jgi:hypothetical protein